MSNASSGAAPPAASVVVGQVVGRQPLALWAAGIVTASACVQLVVLSALSIIDELGGAENASLLPIVIMLPLVLGALVGGTLLTGLRSELRIQIGERHLEIIAGPNRRRVPWDRVRRWWVDEEGAACPVLCLLTDESWRASGWWRFKLHVNRLLFATPVAVPVAGTGLTGRALVEFARTYLDDAVLTPPPARRPGVRVRRLLMASITVAAMTPSAVAVIGAAVYARAATAVSTNGGVVQAAAAYLLAVTVVAAVVWLGVIVYRVVVPGRWLCGREPVVRVGPDGVEHVVMGRVHRAEWQRVRRVQLAADRAGMPFLAVETSDPLALVPRGRGWAARARRHRDRYGVAVAVPLPDSGSTGPDLLRAIRDYAPGSLAVG